MCAQNNTPPYKMRLSIYEMAVFATLGAVMFCSKLIMEVLPNIHLLGMFTMVYTLVFRKKALIPIYVFVMIMGLYSGFSVWWVFYTYVWAVLWGVTMLLPQKMPQKVSCVVYPTICALHGFLFGTLCAPAQALFFGLNFEKTILWIISGLPWDAVHGIGNFCAGLLIVPLSKLLKKLYKKETK